MDRASEVLGRDCYGYGNWHAPFWFIGPEQGQGKREGNRLDLRCDAFLKSSSEGLSDSREFHTLIHEERWHREWPALQGTWRRLMLLLMEYQGRLTGDRSQDEKTLRIYQRDELGMKNGETCLIELSGIPANSFAVPRDREHFLQIRLECIRRRMIESPFRPELVVIYGKGQWKYWQMFPEFSTSLGNIMEIGPTLVVFAPHPHARGTSDTPWIELGSTCRRASNAKH